MPHSPIYWYGRFTEKIDALNIMELQGLDRTQIYTDNVLKILIICVRLCPKKEILILLNIL